MLVVDDDPILRDVIVQALEDEGYRVVEATDGSAALVALEVERPALILLDMRMPVMDGWAFMVAYRARPGSRAPVVVFAASPDAELTRTQVKAEACLGKPFELDALLGMVAQLVQ